MADLTLPNASVPVIGTDGKMTPDWYRFFVALVKLINGAL